MTLSLIDRYPGTASLPRVGLCDLPTPVELLPVQVDADGLFVKRDDLTSLLYGGNKVRKLEFLFGQARTQGARAVITFGAYGSNHALATAVHARALGLEPHVVLSPQPPGPYAARTLRAHAGLGTVIHPIDGWDGRREAVLAKRELEERDGVAPYVIPMGGTDRHGVIGYVNAGMELASQVPIDVVYVAAGTLGTSVGLAIGLAAASSSARVVAVRVTPEQIANAEVAANLAHETSWLLNLTDATFPQMPLAELAFELRHDFFEPGYAVATDEARSAVAVAAQPGLALETTYTGKAFAALLADAEAGRLKGKHVLFWDTYSSAPLPAAGPDEVLPPVLREYVAECDRLFGPAGPIDEGGTG